MRKIWKATMMCGLGCFRKMNLRKRMKGSKKKMKERQMLPRL